MLFRRGGLWFFSVFFFTIVELGWAEQKFTIIYEGNAQFEIILNTGQRILTDVYDPDRLSRPAGPDDILLTTHHHWDHYHKEFVRSFPGTHRDYQGQWSDHDLKIRSIRASHASCFVEPLHHDDEMLIFSIRYHQFHIVHMGDTAQLKLEKSQIKLLKNADVVITNLRHDPRGYLDSIGFGPVQQIKPSLTIPSHLNRISGEYAIKTRQGFQTVKNSAVIRASHLRKPEKILFFGKNAREFHSLPEWQ